MNSIINWFVHMVEIKNAPCQFPWFFRTRNKCFAIFDLFLQNQQIFSVLLFSKYIIFYNTDSTITRVLLLVTSMRCYLKIKNIYKGHFSCEYFNYFYLSIWIDHVETCVNQLTLLLHVWYSCYKERNKQQWT